MEDWQIKYVTDCKPRLLQLTSCNPLLLSYLGSILSSEEMQNLGKLAQNNGNVNASGLLYDILQTRIRGYEIMTKALFNCSQSGALAVFFEGFQKQQIENPFELCDIQLEPSTYFDKAVTWQSAEENLWNIVKSIDDDKLRAIFKKNLSGDEYLQLSDEPRPFCLFENTVPAPLPHYIERRIIQRKYLDASLFKCECSDIFVIKGLEKSQLSELAGLEMTCSSTSFRKNVRFVHLERDKDFTSICKVTNVPTHLVRCQNGKFELLKSSGGLETVHKFLKPDPLTIHEETFIRDYVLDTEENVCIADSPGMGKSVFLARVAEKCVSVGKNLAIYLKLEILLQTVKSKSSEEINFVELWTYILSHAAKTKFALALLQELIIMNTDLRLYLFLDGFDEVLPSQREKAKIVLQCLVNNCKFKNMQILVTTRLHLQGDLESVIGSRAFEIAPIDSWDQKTLILKYWEIQGYNKTKDAEKLAKKYLDSITETAGGFEKDVTCSPMICTMLAELYQHEAENFYFKYAENFKETEPKEQDAILNFTDFYNKPFFYVGSTITELYNKILHMKFEKSASGSSISNVNKNTKSGIKTLSTNSFVYNAHVAAAIELLFPDWKEKLERYFQNQGALDTDDLFRMGIMEPKGFNKPLGFVHRSFAEYLIADFILSKAFNCPEHEDIVYFLFSRVLTTFGYVEQLLKYPYFDRQLTTVKSFSFLYPTIVNFLNGLMENKFKLRQDNEHSLCAMVPEAYKNTNILYEMISACIFPGHVTLISFIKDSFLSGDTTLFTIQMNESDIPWENLVYIAAKYGTEIMLEKCYEIYDTFNIVESPEIIKCENTNSGLLSNIFAPLHVAAERGNYHVFEFLVKTHLKRGQNIEDYKCLLHICVSNSSNHLWKFSKEKCEIIDYLMGFPVDFLNEQEPTTGRTPLLMDNVHFDILIQLLKKGANVCVKDIFSESIAHSASKHLSPKKYYELLTNEKVFRHLNQLLGTETRTMNLTGTHSNILRMNAIAVLEENKMLILFQVDIGKDKDYMFYMDDYMDRLFERRMEIFRKIEHIGKRISFEEDDAYHFNFITCRDGAAFFIDNTQDTQEEFTDHVTVKPVSNVMERVFDSIFDQLSQNARGIDLGEIISLWEEKCAYVSSQGLSLNRKHRSISERDLELLDFYGSNFKRSLESLQTDKGKLQQKQDTGIKVLTPLGNPKYSSIEREERGVPSSISSSPSASNLPSPQKQIQKEGKIAVLEMPKADYSNKVEDPDNVVFQGKYFVLTSPIWSRVRRCMRSFLGSKIVQKLSEQKQYAYFTLLSILMIVLMSRVMWALHERVK